jgi:chromosome segregation ATPase
MSTRIVKLDDPKLKKLIVEKEGFVNEGRKVAGEIDLIKESQKSVEQKLVEEESKVDVSEFDKALLDKRDEMLALLKLSQRLERQRYDHILKNTPQELRDQYDQLEKQKEKKEQELNKLGHKVQKVKDRIIPIIHKLGKPHLEDEFEDFSTSKLDDTGTPVIEIYSRLEEWKAAQRSTK